MQWKAHKVSLQTTWYSQWNFPWSWGDFRWARIASWYPQETWGMRLRCTSGVHWWTIFCTHPAALLPTMSTLSRRCCRLGQALLICTYYFWWYWGLWKVVGRGDCHSIWCCAPGLWCYGLEYSQRHVCLWGGTGMVVVRLFPLRSTWIAWYEYWFPPGIWSKYIPWWVL